MISSAERRKPSLAETIQGTVITAETLLHDNKGAENQINSWVQEREAGNLFMIYGCSDSRVLRLFPGTQSIMYPTIAASGHDHREKSRIKHKGKIVAGHWPCGGCHAKAKETKLPKSGLREYIETKIKHANPVLNALDEAFEASLHSEEPVLAALADQTTADIIPFGLFQKGKAVALAKNIDRFDPTTMSLTDLPHLALEQTGVFEAYLREAKKHKKKLRDQYPDFAKTQENQNPPVLFLDTESNPPLSVRFPMLQHPGSAFRIAIEGDRIEQEFMQHFKTALNQAEYPLKNFGALKTTVIQAATLEKARKLAKKFVAREIGRTWLEQEDTHLILIGGTGVIDEMVTIKHPEGALIRPSFPRTGTIFPPIE